MDSKDKYINLELQKILDQYITNEKYQEFKPVLDEIFQRRAFEFDFSLDRMTQDLKNFTTNVDKIEMVPSEEFEKRYGGSENTLGLFDIKGKKIALNIGLIEKDSKVLINKFLGDPAFDVEFVKNQIGQMILKALTHEAYHAMSDKDRLMYYNQYNIKSGIYLDEVFVESATTRTTTPKREMSILQGYEKTNGYEDITFTTSMLAYALGASQKEVISKGLNNYKELFQFFSSKFSSSSLSNFIEIIDSFNMNIDGYLKSSQTDKEGRRELIKNIYQDLFEINNLNVEQDDREVSLEYLGEIFYRDKKIKDITAESLRFLLSAEQISEDDAIGILKNLEKPGLQMDNQLLDMFEVYQRKISPDSKEYGYAKTGRLRDIVAYGDNSESFQDYLNTSNEERLQNLLRVTQNDPERKFFKYITKVKKDDFEQNVEWNNDVNKTLFEIYQQNKTKENRNVSFDDNDSDSR